MSEHRYPECTHCGSFWHYPWDCPKALPPPPSPSVTRHDPEHEDRTALRKLRLLAIMLRDAHTAVNHPTVASYRGRIEAILIDVEASIAREEARVSP